MSVKNTLLSLTLGLVATLAHPQQKGDIAYLEIVHVKPGTEEQFEATLKRHWGWHTKMGEQWSYLVWTIDSGKNEGAYQISSFGHTWDEVDASNSLLVGTPAPEENPEPFHLSVQESYYRYRADLSAASPITEPLPVATVTHILVKPGAVPAFEKALQEINQTVLKSGHPLEVQSRWYELVTGGEWPQFLLIEDRPNWASFRSSGQLEAIVRDALGKPAGEEIRATFWRSIESVYVETMRYQPDLSRLHAR